MADVFSFGHWLTIRRGALHLSRPELARRIACATITLRKIEEDARRPSPELAARLADQMLLSGEERGLFIDVARSGRGSSWLPAPEQIEPSGPRPRSAPIEPPRQRQHIIKTNLPAQLTSFVGRGQELADLRRAIATHRLVTLTGPGGVGKTRLAIEAGIQVVGRAAELAVADGVWLVELASIEQPTLVAPAVARLFNIAEQPGRSAIELLGEYLAGKQLLLILDNCEHLIDVCADVVARLLQRCWQLRIVATSRAELRIPGEQIVAVPPLALPDDRARRTTSAATQLFVDRSGAAPRAQSAEQSAAIATICRQLDGIPLAIELAAPLARSMTLTEIEAQLEDQMAVLTTTYRHSIPRHQTMRGALAWSYQLLQPHEQRLLRCAAVFVGGWTIEALAAVCAEQTPAQLQLGLRHLVDASLVLMDHSAGQRRYRMLEPVRQFAVAELRESGELAPLRRHHAAYFLSLAEQMGPARDTSAERGWLERLDLERANLRAVNSWAIERGERTFAIRFNGLLFAFWIYCSSVAEADRLMTQVLAIKPATDVAQTGDVLATEAAALDVAGYCAVLCLEYTNAALCFARELAIWEALGDPRGVAAALRGGAFTAMLRGNLAEAQQFVERAQRIVEAAGDRWGRAWGLHDLGYLALVRGEVDEAQRLLEAALIELDREGIGWGAFRTLLALGHVARGSGATERARHAYHEALRRQQRMHYVHTTADGLEGLGGLAAENGNPARAAWLFGAASAQRAAMGMPRYEHQQPWFDRDVALAQRQLDASAWEEAWAAGSGTTLEQAVAEALRTG